MSGPPPEQVMIAGEVIARPCECCGHHEIGVVTERGDYIPLRPGMQVRIINPSTPERSAPKDA